ncbi:MAG: penicillin-binding protein A [Tissierellia bacterium]|nr:penicillin-binding protein A [Tissierellia bacterium]
MNQNEKKKTLMVLGVMSAMLLSLVVYLTYFQMFSGPKIEKSALNKRNYIADDTIKRGDIVDRNGYVLASSVENNGIYTRTYSEPRLYSHVIGYFNKQYGKSGLELTQNDVLTNTMSSSTITAIKRLISGDSSGNSIKLTIDTELQRKARELLSGQKGAVVALDPRTGEILCMVSLPDFDVSTLTEQWETLNSSQDSPLLNRATQGLYAPGSTFKILSTIAQLETLNNEEEVFECTGHYTVGGYDFSDYGGRSHGNINLEKAFALSCNTYFARMSEKLSKANYVNVGEKVYFNKDLPFDLPMSTGRLRLSDITDKTALASTAIGQGSVLSNPLNMLMATSAIANNGELMKPYLVKEVVSPNGSTTEIQPKKIGDVTSHEISKKISAMMRRAVTSGTGTQAETSEGVAGKTGTAETSTGSTHAWFTGFAPYDNPKIAVTVILENNGSTGGSAAAPIAREIIRRALN